MTKDEKTAHRIVIWKAGDTQVLYCDEPDCPQRNHEVKEGVCYPIGVRTRYASVHGDTGRES